MADIDNMIDIRSLDRERISLGRQGENKVREIRIDVNAWIEQYPGCEIVLVALRPGEREMYVPNVTLEDGILTWPILAQDTALAGSGRVELRLMYEELLEKSAVGRTWIEPGLEGIVYNTPTVPPNWVKGTKEALEQANALMDDALQAANAANAAAENLSGEVAAAIQTAVDAAEEQIRAAAALQTARSDAQALRGESALRSVKSVALRSGGAQDPEEDEETGTINVRDLLDVKLGRQGENDTQTVVIDASAWLTELPGCELQIAAIRPGENEVYLPAVTVASGVITWPILAQDTYRAGAGRAEVRAILNGKIKKSVLFRTQILPSLEGDGSGEVPTPPYWATEILEAVDDAEDAAEAAAASASATEEAAVNSVRYDSEQELTAAQQATARENIGAVAVQQGAENAGKALVVNESGNVVLGEAGMPEEVKTALLDIFQHVAFVDDSGPRLYAALQNALDGEEEGNVISISASLDPNVEFYVFDVLDTLRDYLTVTASYSDGTTAIVHNYTLNGTLNNQSNTITVGFGGCTTTVTITTMPMRVLRNGNPDVARPVIRFQCKNCDCLFEAERHEYSAVNDYRNGYYYRARCPCCGGDVTGGVLVKKKIEKREEKAKWKRFGSE